MSEIAEVKPEPRYVRFGSKAFIAYTVLSALAVWLGLSIVETLVRDQCNSDGLEFHWTRWSCSLPSGTILQPLNLRRAGSD
ncbi:MAG: hypothetical protein ACRETL_07755 [Gammaproteobacteria bacterium]